MDLTLASFLLQVTCLWLLYKKQSANCLCYTKNKEIDKNDDISP